MTSHLGQIFSAEKVSQKWESLETKYKKSKRKGDSTGQGRCYFEFFDEMDSILAAHHDIEPVVTGTAAGITVHRPGEVDLGHIQQRQPVSRGPARGARRQPAATSTQDDDDRWFNLFARHLELNRELGDRLVSVGERLISAITENQ